MERNEPLIPLRKIFEPGTILVLQDDPESTLYKSVDQFVCGQLSDARDGQPPAKTTEMVAVRSHHAPAALLLISNQHSFSEKELCDRILALQPKAVVWSRSDLKSISTDHLAQFLEKKEVAACIGI